MARVSVDEVRTVQFFNTIEFWIQLGENSNGAKFTTVKSYNHLGQNTGS